MTRLVIAEDSAILRDGLVQLLVERGHEVVAKVGTALDPEVVRQLIGSRRQSTVMDRLTPRKREVLELMAEGHSNSALAQHLSVTGARYREACLSDLHQAGPAAVAGASPPRARGGGVSQFLIRWLRRNRQRPE